MEPQKRVQWGFVFVLLFACLAGFSNAVIDTRADAQAIPLARDSIPQSPQGGTSEAWSGILAQIKQDAFDPGTKYLPLIIRND